MNGLRANAPMKPESAIDFKTKDIDIVNFDDTVLARSIASIINLHAERGRGRFRPGCQGGCRLDLKPGQQSKTSNSY